MLVSGYSTLIRVLTFVLGVLDTNTYLIYDDVTRDAVVIDPAEESRDVVEWIHRLGLRVRAIVATHGHFDHVLGVDYLRSELGTEFYMHRDDVWIARESMEWLRIWGLEPREAPKPDILIDSDTVLELGSLRLQLLHTPGHTPGSMCIYIDSDRTLFSGDTLFSGTVGRTDLPGGSWKDLVNSLRKIFTTLPSETLVYPGHGPSTTLKREQRANPFVEDALRGLR